MGLKISEVQRCRSGRSPPPPRAQERTAQDRLWALFRVSHSGTNRRLTTGKQTVA